jgi:predicted glycosyltransferase
MKVLIVVTHLLGTGHLSRALTLARAFADAGHLVRLASGGMPVPHLDHGTIDLVQIPSLRSNGVDFTRLLTPAGEIADHSYLQQRSAALTGELHDCVPDVVITELFPFGRRSLTSEFKELLIAASKLPNRPVILSSIRDILAPPSKPAKAVLADGLIAEFYDGVLVHSDPSVAKLDISWPVSSQLRDKLLYTGYVAPPATSPHPQSLGEGEILVSAGGGAVGTQLYTNAIKAAAQTPELRWRLLVGGGDVQSRIIQLGPVPDNVAIEPARPDFRQMLLHAAASVSMCGYNTALDLLQAGTPAVLVPFDDGQEVEQTLRARSLAHLAGIEVLSTGDLTPQRLCAALRAVLQAPARSTDTLHFDGAARSVVLAQEITKARR